MNKPLFSVIMPVFNKQGYILESIQSVLCQTYHEFELIVIDDGSTDDSVAVVKQLFDNRVRHVTQSNRGVAAARNRGIEEAQGSFICFLDADDTWAPDYLLTVHEMITFQPHAHMYATAYFELLADGKQSFPALPVFDSQESFYQIYDFYRCWYASPFTCTCAITLRRDYLLRSGIRFPVGESAGEDQDVWFRIIESGEVVFSPKRLVMYRRNVDGNLSAAAPMSLLPCYQRLDSRLSLPHYPKKLMFSARRLLGKHRLEVAWINILSGKSGEAWPLILNIQVIFSPALLMRCLVFLLLPLLLRRFIYCGVKQYNHERSLI